MKVTRALVGMSVLAPLAAGGAALLLLAKALVGAWLWGLAAAAAFVVAYGLVFWLVLRWARRNPDAVAAFNASWGRAMAFGSGGREPRKRDQDKRR